MRTAVGYCRYSSDMQREESIEAQQEAISRYAAREDTKITQWYIDRAKSGKTDDRPEFLQMVSDLKRKVMHPEFVLCHKLDRFARNRTDAAIYRRDIRRMGIKVIAVAQPLDPENKAEDILLESLLDGLAEYYSANLRNEVLKGTRLNAKKCKYHGGTVPFGFKVNDDGHYEIEESEAVAIRRMFEMVLERRTYRDIEQMMMPYRTRQGRMFTQTTIFEMLQNPKYCGSYVYGRAPRMIEGKRNWRQGREGNPDAIRIENGIPAIISREVFDRVQKVLKVRRRGPRDRGTIYLLTGKIYCGDCKSPMVGTSQRREKDAPKPYRYYQCSGKKRRITECNNHVWPKEEIEQQVMAEVQKVLAREGLADAVYEEYAARERGKDNVREPKEREVKEFTDKIDRLLDFVEQGIQTTDTASRIREYDERRQVLQDELNEINTDYGFTRKHFTEFFDHLLATVNMAEDSPQDARKALDYLVERIDLHPDGEVKVLLRFTLVGADKPGAEGGT